MLHHVAKAFLCQILPLDFLFYYFFCCCCGEHSLLCLLAWSELENEKEDGTFSFLEFILEGDREKKKTMEEKPWSLLWVGELARNERTKSQRTHTPHIHTHFFFYRMSASASRATWNRPGLVSLSLPVFDRTPSGNTEMPTPCRSKSLQCSNLIKKKKWKDQKKKQKG